MTTELILLLSLTAFILFGVVLGDNGIQATFRASSPRLGARLERNLATGVGFSINGEQTQWARPSGRAPVSN